MKNLTLILAAVATMTVWAGETASSKKVVYRKTQSVNFEDQDIDGKVNSPDGAYLLQKRGVKFFPLYKVNNEFEKNILGSVEYLK